jgi:hypothetical protein
MSTPCGPLYIDCRFKNLFCVCGKHLIRATLTFRAIPRDEPYCPSSVRMFVLTTWTMRFAHGPIGGG